MTLCGHFCPQKNNFLKFFFKIFKIIIESRNVIFLLFCQKSPAVFYAKNRNKLSLKMPISQCVTLRTFKNGRFKKKNLNLRIFQFFLFFEYFGNRSRYFTNSKSAEFVVF